MPYQQITRQQLRQLLKNQLGAASGIFWRDTELNFYLQEAVRFYNLLTGFWKKRVTLTTTAGTVWYALPNAITSSMRISWQGFPMNPSSPYEMDFGRTNWESETTTSGGDVPTRPQLYIPAGLNLIGIWPADAAGNSAMTIDGLASTPLLNDDSSFLDLGQEELTGLLDLCQHIAVFKEGGKEFGDSQETLKTFLKAAAEKNSALMASAPFRRFLGLDQGPRRKVYRSVERLGAR